MSASDAPSADREAAFIARQVERGISKEAAFRGLAAIKSLRRSPDMIADTKARKLAELIVAEAK